jgi:hypothetical protein
MPPPVISAIDATFCPSRSLPIAAATAPGAHQRADQAGREQQLRASGALYVLQLQPRRAGQ